MIPNSGATGELLTELLDGWFPDNDVGLQSLRAQMQTVDLPAGHYVFRRGEPCRNYLVVLDGSVRVQASSVNGRDVVLYRVSGGQSCVFTTACLISAEAYPAEGVTETDTRALVVSQGVFNELLGKSEMFRRFVFSGQGRRLGELIQRIEDVAFGRVDVRLARLLCDRCSGEDASLKATHQQLASELGTAREVISRQLKSFEKRGWIKVRRGSVELLDLQPLMEVWRQAD